MISYSTSYLLLSNLIIFLMKDSPRLKVLHKVYWLSFQNQCVFHWKDLSILPNIYKQLPIGILILLWEDIGGKIFTVFSPAIPQRFGRGYILNLSCLRIFFQNSLLGKWKTLLSPLYLVISSLFWFHYLRWFKEMMKCFNIFELSSELVRKNEFYLVGLV